MNALHSTSHGNVERTQPIQRESNPERRPMIHSGMLRKQRIKLFCRLSDSSKRILKGTSKMLEFLRDTFHRERVGKEEQFSRSMHLPILDHF